jgi:predicted Fe-S protein YdhL (DUF1289 family)
MDTAAKISTPCIRVCKLLNDVCYACQRTRQEITNWCFYSEHKRREIMEDINERRKRR